MSPPLLVPLRDSDAMAIPCPFCGGDALALDTMPDPYILCLACGARGPLGSTAEEAVILWNGCQDCVARWNAFS